MSNEVSLAFAHPSERAAATASGPLDRISLRDHIVEVEIGAFQAERGSTQRICFNVVVEVQPVVGHIDDDVDRILSYDRVTEAIAAELEAERLNLLETLAERVAERVLLEPQAVRAFVRIEKLDRGPGALGVEIVRSSGDLDGDLEADAPQPRIVFLTNEAIRAEGLKGWLDQLEADSTPTILCVAAPTEARPHSDARLAQRRIDFLAIEQNAWVLAGRDRRCVVVGTLTELDWGMKHGQISVWAPSKVVLDALDGPPLSAATSEPLAAWFADHMDASEVVGVGTDLPATQAQFRQIALDAEHIV